MTLDEKIVEAVARAIDPSSWKAWDGARQGKPNPVMLRHTEGFVQDSLTTARAAITAYQAEAWQPWETVPRDGDDVLARNGDFHQIVFWDEQENTGWHVADADIRYPEGAFTHWRRDCLASPAPKVSPTLTNGEAA